MTSEYQPTPRELYDLISSLKEATEVGFSRVDGRINRVEGRMTSIDGKLSGIERWAARVDERLATMDGRLTSIGLRPPTL